MLKVRELANAIRFLSVDAVQKANSGHPGMPLGMAEIATVLWREFLRHNPENPKWLNRDRFILSNGHGSMLQYSLLHLTGYPLTIDDLKQFRQLHSKTPGHPELGVTPGIETTTGPLGQGLANAVGMAIAEKTLAATFNRPGFNIIDHHIYVFVGDGCLMEGISHEVCSLAGTHGLGKLIVFWDNNGISIDGNVSNWYTDDNIERFLAYGWQVIEGIDGHDSAAVRAAIFTAHSTDNKPTLICAKTKIGFGAPTLCGSHTCHGSPLGENEIANMRKNLNWPYPAFEIPEEIYQAFDAREKGSKQNAEWQELFNKYQKQYPELAAELLRRISGELPANFAEKSKEFSSQIFNNPKTLATRQSSQECIAAFGSILPELFGGSADLTPSNLTAWSGSKDLTKDDPLGNYLHYGVREFGMFAIMTGISLYGGFIPYGGTFLVFISYGHSAIRMIAMMRKQAIYVLSHDSIGLGEDGPTHQPMEQLNILRVTPNVSVWRPADELETFFAWEAAILRKTGPTALVLSRQKLTPQKRDFKTVENIRRGGYILLDCAGVPEAIIIATGSEVALAVTAAAKLNAEKRRIRVVSMPSADVFLVQDADYQESVLPKGVAHRLALEAGATSFWYRFVGLEGKIVGIDTYGESAPEKELFAFFGLTEQNVRQILLKMLS